MPSPADLFLHVIDLLTDPGEIALVRSAYNDLVTGRASIWASERPEDLARLREIFNRTIRSVQGS